MDNIIVPVVTWLFPASASGHANFSTKSLYSLLFSFPGEHLYSPCYCEKCNGAKRRTITVRKHAFLSRNGSKRSDLLQSSPINAGATDSLYAKERAQLESESSNYEEGINDTSSGCEDNLEFASAEDHFHEAANSNELTYNFAVNVAGQQINSLAGGGHENPQRRAFTENEINRAVLGIVRDKVKYGWSRLECLSQLRNLFDLTADQPIPHVHWNSVLAFLKTLGYVTPKEYKICVSDTHVCLLDDKEDCAICGQSWSDYHSYHVIGMKPESIFLSTDSIIQHLAHWRERNEWFRKDTITVPRRELWHGEQFCNISFFFDETAEYLLPALCLFCNATISTEQIEERCGMNPLTGQSGTITCTECLEDNLVEIKYARGNPLDQVFIFHEDSFNAFFKRMKKNNRYSTC